MLSETEFEAAIREIHALASNGGVEAVRSAGFKFDSAFALNKLPRKAHRIFLKGCHYGFGLAQGKVGARVISIHKEVQTAHADLRHARRDNDKNAELDLQRKLTQLARQERLLRRSLDVVLLQIVGNETWVLRRLKMHDREKHVDSKSLEATLQEAWRRNKEDRYIFHLVTDLLTAVDVGDLIRIDKSDEAKRKWSIIELKSGTVNDKFRELLASSKDIEKLNAEASKISPAGPKQIRRMMRQTQRQERVEEIIDTDKGIDPTFEVPISLYDAPRDTEDYLGALREISNLLVKKDHAAFEVQGCIYLVGVREHSCEYTALEGYIIIFTIVQTPINNAL